MIKKNKVWIADNFSKYKYSVFFTQHTNIV